MNVIFGKKILAFCALITTYKFSSGGNLEQKYLSEI